MKKLKYFMPFVAGLLIPYYANGVLHGYDFVSDPSIGDAQAFVTILTVFGTLFLAGATTTNDI